MRAELNDALSASGSVSWPVLNLAQIERIVSDHLPKGLRVTATEDHDGVCVWIAEKPTLEGPMRETSFIVSRLQLCDAVNPSFLLEVLTHKACAKLNA